MRLVEQTFDASSHPYEKLAVKELMKVVKDETKGKDKVIDGAEVTAGRR